MFQFGENLFDGVEVWGIGRQEQKPGSGSPDGAAHRLALVATEIVEDDDVARLQRWNQNLIDIGPEALAVDWTIENPWGLDTITDRPRDRAVDHLAFAGLLSAARSQYDEAVELYNDTLLHAVQEVADNLCKASAAVECQTPTSAKIALFGTRSSAG